MIELLYFAVNVMAVNY